MTNEVKRAEPKGTIDSFKLVPQSFGRLPVIAATLVTGGLPQEAFKASVERQPATTPPPDRR